jgi:5-methylcytosine-specific restriction endonuclease McrA
MKNRQVKVSKLIQRDGPGCWYCGAMVGRLTIDHVHPRSRGGSNALENLRLACTPCNSLKASMTLAEMAEWMRSPDRAKHTARPLHVSVAEAWPRIEGL